MQLQDTLSFLNFTVKLIYITLHTQLYTHLVYHNLRPMTRTVTKQGPHT